MIRELYLRNFKCFEDQVFQLRPLTLLTGLNSSGKSTVLQALLLLRQSYQQGLLQTDALALNGDLVYIGAGRDALFEGAKQEEIGFDLSVQNEMGVDLKTGWRFEYLEDSDILDEAGFRVPANSDVYETSLFTNSFHYLQAERIGPRRFFEVSKIVADQLNQLGSRGEYTASFLSHAQYDSLLDKRLMHPEAASGSLQHQVEAWLGEISPGIRINLTSIRNIGIVGLEYAFVVANQVSNNYRSMNVGFGITFVLPVIVSVLTSSPGTLLLVENPEAHLHPKGQSTMGKLLALAASSGIQLLVETHSDHVLNGIRIAVHDGELKPDDVQIHFFQKREQDGRCEVISPQIDRDGRLDRWPEGFFDEFDKSLDVLMQPGKE